MWLFSLSLIPSVSCLPLCIDFFPHALSFIGLKSLYIFWHSGSFFITCHHLSFFQWRNASELSFTSVIMLPVVILSTFSPITHQQTPASLSLPSPYTSFRSCCLRNQFPFLLCVCVCVHINVMNLYLVFNTITWAYKIFEHQGIQWKSPLLPSVL